MSLLSFECPTCHTVEKDELFSLACDGGSPAHCDNCAADSRPMRLAVVSIAAAEGASFLDNLGTRLITEEDRRIQLLPPHPWAPGEASQ